MQSVDPAGAPGVGTPTGPLTVPTRPVQSALSERSLRTAIGLFLVTVTLALYWPATRFEFTNFDDPGYVTENPMVQGGLSWAGIQWALTSTTSSLWLPVTRLAHLATWEIFGPASGGHHLVNIVIHAITAMLAFVLFQRLTGATLRSAFAAALFAWHPLRVESVAWVAELKDVLGAFFWILTMILYARSVRSGRRADRWSVVAIYAVGLMCKPMLVTLPCALLLLDVWPLRRLRLPFLHEPVPPAPEPVSASLRWTAAIREKVPLFVLAFAVCVVTMVTAEKATSGGLPASYRLANALVSYARYLGKTFCPVDLAALYPHPGHWPAAAVAGSALLVSALSAIALQSIHRRPYLFTGWFWFVGTLVPVIGLIQAGPQAMADRFTYVPSLGLTVALVWGVAGLSRHLPFGCRGAGALGLITLLALVTLTRGQLMHWQNSITLFEHTLALTENNEIAHHNLGQALAASGRVPEAVPHYESAVRIDPNYEDAWNNLGVAHSILGDRTKAEKCYREALRVQPGHVGARFNLGLVRYLEGRLPEALTEFAETLRLAPHHAAAHLWSGRAHRALQQQAEARQHFERALQLNPGSTEARSELEALSNHQTAPGPSAPPVR